MFTKLFGILLLNGLQQISFMFSSVNVFRRCYVELKSISNRYCRNGFIWQNSHFHHKKFGLPSFVASSFCIVRRRRSVKELVYWKPCANSSLKLLMPHNSIFALPYLDQSQIHEQYFWIHFVHLQRFVLLWWWWVVPQYIVLSINRIFTQDWQNSSWAKVKIHRRILFHSFVSFFIFFAPAGTKEQSWTWTDRRLWCCWQRKNRWYLKNVMSWR